MTVRDTPLKLDAFCAHLATELVIERSRITPATRFVDDLEFTSLQLLDLLVLVEELGGVELSDEMLGRMDTVAAAYEIYRSGAQGRHRRADE
jgi:acyl carrier protein